MILGYYVMIVLTGVLLFYLIPQWRYYYSLLLVATGEQQWQNLNQTFPKWLLVLFQFLYGFVVLLLLFGFTPIKFNILFSNCKLNGSSALFFWTPFKFQLDYLLVYGYAY
jgi:hypothetical protein